MQQVRTVNRLPWNRWSTVGRSFRPQRPVHQFSYRHILVYLGPNAADRASLLLGFELASLHQSALTLLRVLPPQKRGLDAFDLLHSAADEFRRPSLARSHGDWAPSQVRSFVTDTVPAYLLDAVHWQEECRSGALAEAVVDVANESACDLVIVPAAAFRGWLPYIFELRSIRRRTRASVIVIRQQADSFASASPRRSRSAKGIRRSVASSPLYSRA